MTDTILSQCVIYLLEDSLCNLFWY